MNGRMPNAVRVAIIFALGSALTSGVCEGAAPLQLAGSIVGSVRDNGGVPQMGAVVQLYNRLDKPIWKAITNANGEFGFDSLVPDIYSVRVSLSSFVPALKRNINIQAGMRNVLAINLATVMSSIELVYSAPNAGTLMNDDWKWVLRSSMATRPVLRMLPDLLQLGNDEYHRAAATVFSDTRGLLRVASGESNPFSALGNQPDLGTSFALATSIFGRNQVQVSGNIGYAMNSELPTAGFRTTFSRPDLGGPEVKLTMQQVSLPVRGSPVLNSTSAAVPALRTMSITLLERIQVADGVQLDYGASLDSVTFVERLNYVSPFARLSYQIGANGVLDVGYSSGAPPVELLNRGGEADSSFQADLSALSLLPRVSLRNGQAEIQRTQNVEVGYRLQAGSRSYNVGFYREAVANGALTVAAPDDFYYSRDLLPELSSRNSVFNIGSYTRTGYTASVTQVFGENFSATVAIGRGGVLGTRGGVLSSGDPDELRAMITRVQRHWVRGKIAGTAPGTGTKYSASYEWTDYNSLIPGHVFLTQRIYPETGLNIRVRQPLPGFGGLPGRLELTSELRNLLAQGYLPIALADGRRLVLAHSPRAIRGGVSFIF